MQVSQTNAGAAPWMRGLGVFGLYGGSVALALALILAGWTNGLLSQVASVATGAMTTLMADVMAAVSGVARAIL